MEILKSVRAAEASDLDLPQERIATSFEELSSTNESNQTSTTYEGCGPDTVDNIEDDCEDIDHNDAIIYSIIINNICFNMLSPQWFCQKLIL